MNTPLTALRPRRILTTLAAALVLLGLVAVGASLQRAVADDAAADDWRSVTLAVDRLVANKLEAAGVKPAPRSEDAEFLRRVYLDLLGTVPTPEEVDAFLSDRAKDKRAKKIDALMASEAYAENQASFWFRTLTGLSVHQPRTREGQGGRYITGEAGRVFHEWLAEQVRTNRPYDQMVEAMIAAEGRTDENGAAGYLARWEGNVNNTAGAVSRHFLGVQIQCAQCHDHIYEPDWKQADFQGMAAFFAQTTVRRVPEYRELQRMRQEMQRQPGSMQGEPPNPRAMSSKMRELVKYRNIVEVRDNPVDPRLARRLAQRLKNAQNEELKARASLMSVQPKFWMGSSASDLPGLSRRFLLARWVTSQDNPYFARALVNRMFGAFMGRGIVHPVDDFNSFQDPSHPRLLDVLAEDFRSHGHDLQRLQRILLNSETYQRSSRLRTEQQPDPALFAKAPVRPLGTEQLYFSLVRATGMETRLNQAARRQGQQVQRAIFSTFTFVFDDDEGQAQEDFAGSIPQGLFLMNGQLLHSALTGGPARGAQRAPQSRRGRVARDRTPQGMLATLLREESKDAARVDHLYLRAYGRHPDASERKDAVKFVKAGGSSQQAYEDLFWAMLNSAEFMTNH